MSLGFTINASPLSQISVAISDIATAVQLATGVYGWWKSNERSQSLDQALTTAGGHLVASSAFNLQCYKDIRQCHHVLGAVVGEGTIRTVALPRASTAISDDPGRTCLRALTTALLCLYTTEATVMILADVLPSCLIQLHQEDATFEISGPLFASLKDAVHAIAKEEENDTLGKYLLEQACDDKVILFAGTDDSLRPNLAEHLHEKDLADIALVAGALRWALTSSIQRPSTTYITRSLNVWVLVGMMQRLGFEIMASPVLHAPRAMSDRRDETSTAQDKIASVVLNVTSQGQTDPWEHGVARAGSEDNNFSRPLLTDVATVPWLIHKHLGVRCGASCEYLTQVFNHARLKVKDMDSSLTIMDGQLTLGLSMLANGYPDSSNRFHAGFGMLVNNWSQIGPPLPFHARFPEYTRLAWTVADSFLRTADEALFRSSSRVKAAIRIYRTMPTVQNDSGETLTPIQIFEALFPHSAIQSLMLGSCYGILSHFVLGDKRDDSELDSVAFSPLLLKKELQSGRFSRLLDNFNKLLTGTANYEDLLGSMAKLILGWSQDLPHNKARRDQELILGLQSNGLSILSQFALDPTLDTHSLYRFRVTDGLIVNLPVTENNSVIMHRCLPNKELIYRRDQVTHHGKLVPFEADSTLREDMYRFSLEPCWEHDGKEAVPQLRYKGRECMTVTSRMLQAWLLDYHQPRTVKHVRCSCGSPTMELETDDNESWAHLTVESFLTFSPELNTASQPHSLRLTRSWLRSFDVRSRTLIDARGCTALQLAIIGTADTSHLLLSDGCIQCTYAECRTQRLASVHFSCTHQECFAQPPGKNHISCPAAAKPKVVSNVRKGIVIMMV